jgi:hypothetical protein
VEQNRQERKKKKKKLVWISGLDREDREKKGKKKVFLAVASLILIFAKLTVVRCATDRRRSRYNSVWNGLQRQRARKLVSIVPPRTPADPEKQKRRHHSSRHGNVR